MLGRGDGGLGVGHVGQPATPEPDRILLATFGYWGYSFALLLIAQALRAKPDLLACGTYYSLTIYGLSFLPFLLKWYPTGFPSY